MWNLWFVMKLCLRHSTRGHAWNLLLFPTYITFRNLTLLSTLQCPTCQLNFQSGLSIGLDFYLLKKNYSPELNISIKVLLWNHQTIFPYTSRLTRKIGLWLIMHLRIYSWEGNYSLGKIVDHILFEIVMNFARNSPDQHIKFNWIKFK